MDILFSHCPRCVNAQLKGKNVFSHCLSALRIHNASEPLVVECNAFIPLSCYQVTVDLPGYNIVSKLLFKTRF